MIRQTQILVLILASSLLIGACRSPAVSNNNSSFRHDIGGNAKPWINTGFDASDEKFTFAVFSDLTGGEREGVFEIAVAQLNLLRPELIINVGDLIEGGTTDLTEVKRQWEYFDQRAGRAKARVFYVGGNHDLTGKVLQDVWDQRYGQRYYHFIYRNTLFLILDTEDHSAARMQEIYDARKHAAKVAATQGWDAFGKTEYANMPENAAGNIGAAQAEYFTDVIAANPDVTWTFLFMHKSPWLRADMATFAVIEDALADRPYTLFNGHAHVYEHLERLGRDYIRLATTGGVQFGDRGLSADHVVLVTVDRLGVDIANLKLSGILDKTGRIPLDGDSVCFEIALCGAGN